MTEQMASERCPFCGSERAPVALDSGLGLERAYRCQDCRREWSVAGRQETLFGPLENEQAALDFEPVCREPRYPMPDAQAALATARTRRAAYLSMLKT